MGTFQPYQQTLIILLAAAIVLLPLLAFVINVCLPGKTNKAAGWVSTLAIFISFVSAIIVFTKLWNQPQLHWQFKWFTIGATNVYAGMWLNNHSVIMLLLVPAIALPVHIYSTAYMKHDERYKRYFTYLSLFCFSMLALVVADSMITFYVFWELVGFSSYLLIGFWFTKEKAVLANKKAFIVNRIGDVGLLIAILIIFVQSGSFDLNQLFGSYGLIAQSQTVNGLWIGASTTLPVFWQYVACGGVFLAVAAKTAQFPLHTWLPDAMEGPTSVSALIHAATMVAAGVFLLGRLYPLFTPTELDILAGIGCFTAFMAATIALTQNDLKRILAYSTISQLGFMVMGMGIGAYASSLFHLVTHAFFKCLLFLVAGVVIHEVAHIKEENNLDIDPQNILNMGGLRKKLPFTFMAALVGAAALIGLPITSGYLSKDGILIQAVSWAEQRSFWYMLVPIGAIFATGLTAFYVSRLIVKVFFGEFKLEKVHPHIKFHISDGGWQYKVPLFMLAACSLFPVFSYNPVAYEDAWVFRGFATETALDRVNIFHTIIPLGVTIVSVFVIYFAYSVYVKRNSWSAPQNSVLFKLSYNQWYIDAFYNKVIVGGVLLISKASSWVDRNVIDGFIHLLTNVVIGLAKVAAWFDYNVIDGVSRLLTFIVRVTSNFIRYFQSGKIQYYLFSMMAIVLVLFIYLLF